MMNSYGRKVSLTQLLSSVLVLFLQLLLTFLFSFPKFRTRKMKDVDKFTQGKMFIDFIPGANLMEHF